MDSNQSKILQVTEIKKSASPKILKKAFDSRIYHDGYVTFNTACFDEGYAIADGNLTYFRLQNSEAKIFGESRLSVIVKPNPIDNEVYNYFGKRLLKLIAK